MSTDRLDQPSGSDAEPVLDTGAAEPALPLLECEHLRSSRLARVPLPLRGRVRA
ncbi:MULTISPECIES: hypothetical protein [Rhodococcus]|uniref:hypothetical protein n=1 Tax=Rhodococcus TaxID=1827 RepID=UPI000ACE2F21|nr:MULTISPECIES: hypothetical protein [Rhodococcus]NMD60016.1 hypothetical protein [Nocardia globerula]